MSAERTLTDGQVITVRTERTISGSVVLYEQTTIQRPTAVLVRIGSHLFLCWAGNELVRLETEDAHGFDDIAHAEATALEFFASSAQACVNEAAECGLPVEAMY